MGIHNTAIVDPAASLGRDVEVGAYAVIGAGVELGDETRVDAHGMVVGPCRLGKANVVHSFAVVGGAPQRKRPREGSVEDTASLVMGDRNTVREHATVHRGSTAQGTRIGDDNLFMVGSHVAHDVVLGSHVTLANGVQLAGHVEVGDHVTFGGQSGVAQFVHVDESAFVAAGAMCERDVPPFVIVQGDRARVRALNLVGLRRREVPEASIEALSRAFRALFGRSLPRARAVAAVARGDEYVERLLSALALSESHPISARR